MIYIIGGCFASFTNQIYFDRPTMLILGKDTNR